FIPSLKRVKLFLYICLLFL
ncbi:hypothetical protein NPIL_149481, partial [Nephila pilipes]